MATVLLLRHGETDWNHDRLIQGWAPVALNERGREQARAVGAHLESGYEIDAVVASDLQRTRETAALVTESGVEPDPVFERDWRERGFGVLQGLSYDSVFDDREYDVASANADTLNARPENGESALDLRERVLSGWESVLGRIDPREDSTASDATVLIVTHGGPIHVVLAHIDGIDLPTAFARDHQSNCAVNEIGVDPSGEATVRSRNDTSYREH